MPYAGRAPIWISPPRHSAGVGGAPSISSLSVSAGVEVGGTTVVITGSGFTGATAVKFGGIDAASFDVDDDTQITATAPAITVALSSTSADNTIDVSVTTPAGTDTAEDAYTYTSRAKDLAGSLYHNEWRVSDPRITQSGTASNLPCFNANGDLAQATSGSRPAYGATSFNGGPGLTTTGTPGKWMQASLSSSIASGRRPYLLIVLKIASGNAAWFELSSSGEAAYMEMQRGPSSTWRFYLQPSSFNGTTDLGSDSNTNPMVIEGCFRGTSAFSVDGSNGNNSRTGTTGSAVDRFTLFGERDGAGTSGANSNSTFAYALLLNNEPDSTLQTNLRSFVNGANFPGYTSNKMKP
jgi:hypothetical protein